MRSARQEFPKSIKEQAYDRCGGRCEHCHQDFAGRVPHYDHYPIAASLGGPGTLANCRALCSKCHRHITATIDAPRIAEAKRIEEKRKGWRVKRPMQSNHRG